MPVAAGSVICCCAHADWGGGKEAGQVGYMAPSGASVMAGSPGKIRYHGVCFTVRRTSFQVQSLDRKCSPKAWAGVNHAKPSTPSQQQAFRGSVMSPVPFCDGLYPLAQTHGSIAHGGRRGQWKWFHKSADTAKGLAEFRILGKRGAGSITLRPARGARTASLSKSGSTTR